MSNTNAPAEIAKIGEEMFEAWAEASLTAASMSGRISKRIGAPLQHDSNAATTKGRDWKRRLDALTNAGAPREHELSRRYLAFEASKLCDAEQLHKYDLQITPYRIGLTLSDVHRHLHAFKFESESALDDYLAILRQYRAFLDGTFVNLRAQRGQGIVTPAAALPGCIGVLRALAGAVPLYLGVSPERLTSATPARRDAFLGETEKEVARVREAFAALSSYVEGDYGQGAPETVGLWQYQGGRDAYATLIRHHMTLALTPEQVHQLGVELVQEIEDNMARLRAALGFKGSGREFLDHVKADKRFYCTSAEDVGALYLKLMGKCDAVMGRAFGARQFPPYGVKRLPPESEAGMTFGYYQPPSADGETVGYYMYNGSNLEERTTIGAASLIYHELVPGHHLHVASEMGNPARPLYRRYPTITAFNEGWAEYAADLGWELGLYDDKYDEYGRYLFQVFLASRLVVDTGLNAFGWSLERAAAYLRDHTAQSETEIASETIRYATGLPGQGLAYAPGRKHFWAARREAERRLGDRFSLPAFHDAILDGGSLALDDLSFSIEQWSSDQAS